MRTFGAMSWAVVAGCAPIASAQSFYNTGSFAIPGTGTSGPADPYPSLVNVSGIVGTTASVRFEIYAIFHPRPDDLDVLLVAPGGVGVILMSDAGGSNPMSNVDLFFVDGAPALPDDAPILNNGTYSPTDYEPGDPFPGPAPAGSFGTSLSAFNGLDPNGQWRLFIVDDETGEAGTAARWGVIITPIPAPGACVVAALAVVVAVRRRRS